MRSDAFRDLFLRLSQINSEVELRKLIKRNSYVNGYFLAKISFRISFFLTFARIFNSSSAALKSRNQFAKFPVNFNANDTIILFVYVPICLELQLRLEMHINCSRIKMELVDLSIQSCFQRVTELRSLLIL